MTTERLLLEDLPTLQNYATCTTHVRKVLLMIITILLCGDFNHALDIHSWS
jgi:hypothetical protein